MVRVAAEWLRHRLFELRFDDFDGLARRQASAVADAEDVGVDRECLLAERGVEHDIGGFAAHAGQGFEFIASARDLPAVPVDQRLAERDDVLRLGVEQADGLDGIAQIVLAEVDHLPRGLDVSEQRPAAILTLASVACADRTTATSNW